MGRSARKLLMSGGRAPFEAPTYVDRVDQPAGSTLTWPGGIQSGDLAYLAAFSFVDNETSYPQYNNPSGFTFLSSGQFAPSGSKYTTGHSYKICTGSESGTFTKPITAGTKRNVLIILRPSIGYSFSSIINESRAYSPSSITSIVSSANYPVITLGSQFETSNTSSWSPTPDGDSWDVTGDMHFHWLHYATGDTDTDSVLNGSSNTPKTIAQFAYS